MTLESTSIRLAVITKTELPVAKVTESGSAVSML